MRNIKRGFTRESHRRMGLRFSGRITPNLLFRCRIVAILWSPKPATGVRISPPEPNNNATVPEWPNGKDCKSFVRRFKSDPLLQLPCQFNGQNQSLRNSGWWFDSITGRQVFCGYDVMVTYDFAKVELRVQFSLPAPMVFIVQRQHSKLWILHHGFDPRQTPH